MYCQITARGLFSLKFKVMRKVLFTLTLLAAFGMIAKADIQFNHGPWQEILAQASKENKLVFVDAYTSWCGPCKWMAANTFTNPEVAEFYNANFVNAKIDMEKGEGPGLQEKYNVQAYPTLLFVSASGELFHVAVGALDAAQFIALGKQVLDPKFVSIATSKLAFETHKDDRVAQADYIVRMTEIGQNSDEVLAMFRPVMAGAGLLDADSWAVFKARFKLLDTDEAKYFFAHKADFVSRYGEGEVNAKLLDMYVAAMGRATFEHKEDAYMAARGAWMKSGHPEAEKMALFQDLGWYEGAEDWGKYISTAHRAVAITPDLQPQALNSLAWMFYMGATKKKDLEAALLWANKACTAEPIYAYLDTKAMLLKKLGRQEEAIAVAKEAIEVAKRNKEPYGETEKELNEMLAKKSNKI
jgi:thiol-disulfide isomerase/thioredoxin